MGMKLAKAKTRDLHDNRVVSHWRIDEPDTECSIEFMITWEVNGRSFLSAASLAHTILDYFR